MAVIHIPDARVRRLRGVSADRVAEEDTRICFEIQRLTEIPGVTGAQVTAIGYAQPIGLRLRRPVSSLPAEIPVDRPESSVEQGA